MKLVTYGAENDELYAIIILIHTSVKLVTHLIQRLYVAAVF